MSSQLHDALLELVTSLTKLVNMAIKAMNREMKGKD